MRILVVTPGFLPWVGGAEVGLHEIYSRLGLTHEVYICTPIVRGCPPNPTVEDNPLVVKGFAQAGYNLIRYPNFFDLKGIRGKMLLHGVIPPFSIGAIWATHQQIRWLRPDVVNVHYAAPTGLAALWAQQVCKVPTVLSLVGRDAVPGPLVPHLWPWYSRMVAKRVAHTIFISHFCRSYRPQDKFSWSVIPYGADTHKIRPDISTTALRKELGIPPDVRVLFALQRLAPVKRVDIAIQCVRHLLDWGVDRFILLIGGTGPDAGALKRLTDGLGVHDYVRFLGFVPEERIGEHFALSDIFVCSSPLETFGITLVQAMAAGVPVAATRASAIPEVVEDGRTGLLSLPLDAQALARAIQVLLNDENRRQEMGQRARHVAEALYDWDLVASQYESALRCTIQRAGHN
jgi:glycosyltransferase involved in cell wall biosynthesis